MDITNVIAIAGQPGLFKVVAQAKNGVVVESLIDKKRTTAFGSHKISALEDISIYTTSEDMPLKDVLTKIYDKEKGGLCIDPKTTDEKGLRAYMKEALPDYDEDRVHTSDIKKLFNWYRLLHGAGLLEAKPEETNEDNAKTVKTGDKEKVKNPAVKKDVSAKQNVKTNAPKVKAQGVRKTGSA